MLPAGETPAEQARGSSLAKNSTEVPEASLRTAEPGTPDWGGQHQEVRTPTLLDSDEEEEPGKEQWRGNFHEPQTLELLPDDESNNDDDELGEMNDELEKKWPCEEAIQAVFSDMDRKGLQKLWKVRPDEQKGGGR